MQKLIFLCLFLFCTSTIAQEIQSLEEKAIRHIIQKGIPANDIKPWPKHPLLKNPEKLTELADSIVFAAKEHRMPSMLLVAVAFREASFRQEKVGAIGELSAFQMTLSTFKMARRLDSRCSLETQLGAALCAAVWIKHWWKKHNIRKALVVYATGGILSKSKQVKWLTKDRLKLADKLYRRFTDTTLREQLRLHCLKCRF